MTYRLLYALILGAFGIILTFGCKKDEEPKPDPCKGVKPVSADFEVFDTPGVANVFWQYMASDTITTASFNLKAKEENGLEYRWQVGDLEYKGRSVFVELDWQQIIQYKIESFPVRLIVRKKPNNQCFPNDDGVDTFVKRIYVAKHLSLIGDSCLLNGKFKGSRTDEPGNVFELEIRTDQWNPFYTQDYNIKGVSVKNLHKGCIIYPSRSSWVASYRQIIFDSTGMPDYLKAEDDCPSLQTGSALLLGDLKTLSFKYSFYDPKEKKVKEYQFIGTKISD